MSFRCCSARSGGSAGTSSSVMLSTRSVCAHSASSAPIHMQAASRCCVPEAFGQSRISSCSPSSSRTPRIITSATRCRAASLYSMRSRAALAQRLDAHSKPACRRQTAFCQPASFPWAMRHLPGEQGGALRACSQHGGSLS